MVPHPDNLVLRKKYRLLKPLSSTDEGRQATTWLAQDMDRFQQCLVKLWPFQSTSTNNIQRALWDAELRTLYRISSSPGAEDVILVIRDAGIDHDMNCFAMVMESRSGAFSYEVLDEALRHRSNSTYEWLTQRDDRTRERLWKGLRQIAEAILLLHTQSTLHRDVGAHHVFFHPDDGPLSFRLSGFEWSIRIGELHVNEPPRGWAAPPEAVSDWDNFGFQPETDWFGFGMLAARILLNIEAFAQDAPEARNLRVLRQIDRAPTQHLRDIEKDLLRRLLDHNHMARFVREGDILRAIDDVREAFQRVSVRTENQQLLLVYNPSSNDNLVTDARDAGYVPDPDEPTAPFNPLSLTQCTALSRFIQDDLREAQLFHLKGRENNFVLVGEKFVLRITRWYEFDHSTQSTRYSWDAAYVTDVWNLNFNEGGTQRRDLPENTVIVRTVREVLQNRNLLNMSESWEKYLPYEDRTAELRAELSQFHDFIRCTNQIELLLRDAELFQYEIVQSSIDRNIETVVVRETERERSVLNIFKTEGGLLEFLQRELDSHKDYSEHVALTPEHEGVLFLYRRIPIYEFFRIKQFDVDQRTVTLERIIRPNVTSPPPRGWLRTFGMFGQAALIRRRKDAIERLARHTYLLTSLTSPGKVYLDTGTNFLPQPLPPDKVDSAKGAVMQDVLRTRPIYTLQGPPGTGKTTMVAWLLRQIFDDDPVAQVLITAQAHGAVDVLRSKVRDEAFGDVKDIDQPLTIRLGQNRSYRSEEDFWVDENSLQEGSVEAEAVRIFDISLDRLSKSSLSPLQKKWVQYAKSMRNAIMSQNYSDSESAPEFVELVKRGANITYCTTSAGDLEELARTTQTYDWTIIEEAGKCHGFDLALPMQTGHRWVLIGDPEQLYPFRYRDFVMALKQLDLVVDALRDLPRSGNRLLDHDWLDRWDDMNPEERRNFQDYAAIRLKTFSYLDKQYSHVFDDKREHRTFDQPIGAIAGRLWRQYRMHPTIGTLISDTYYKSLLQNETVDTVGKPLARVTLPLAEPAEIRGVGLVWLDTPPAWETDDARELGPAEHKPRYINPYEATIVRGFLEQLRLQPESLEKHRREPLDLAVLSPYTQQTMLMRNRREYLQDFDLPEGFEAREQLSARNRRSANERPQLVHTVDSFQGNEADVIVVSMVRNNMRFREAPRPLGFLDEPERMNVLLSRAQRLLVLVGSWEFFEKVIEHIDMGDIDRRDEWHIAKMLSMFRNWFADGRAIKLDGTRFMSR